MSFLYYIPNASQGDLTAERLESLGLHRTLDADRLMVTKIVANGPDGGAGALVEPAGGRGTRLDTSVQTWSRAGGVWVGYQTRPTPDALRRPECVGGPSVILEDGQAWQVPIARPVASSPSLPQVLVLNDTNQLTCSPSPKFAAAVELGDRVFRWFTDEGSDATLRDLFDAAVEILGINYTLGPVEASVLGLLTDRNVVEVCQEFIDWPAMRDIGRELAEAQKKSVPAETPATSATGSGVTA